jgi:hypothetical protein
MFKLTGPEAEIIWPASSQEKSQYIYIPPVPDPLILKQTKDAVRVSICHTATVIVNGLMHMTSSSGITWTG